MIKIMINIRINIITNIMINNMTSIMINIMLKQYLKWAWDPGPGLNMAARGGLRPGPGQTRPGSAGILCPGSLSCVYFQFN